MANYYHRSRPRLISRADMSPIEADLWLASIASPEAPPPLSKPIKAAVLAELTRQEAPQFTPLGWPF